MERNTIPMKIRSGLETNRKEIEAGHALSQSYLDAVIHRFTPYKDLLLPGEKEEILMVADPSGSPTPLRAPRWACHLLGLRHRCVHILLKWNSPSISAVFIFQVRSWTKFDEPGRLDMSVSGHVVGDQSLESACGTEMAEELGLAVTDLKGAGLAWKTAYECCEKRPEEQFYNLEWREVFTAEIATSAFDKIRFSDSEVVGLYLCPALETKNLLHQQSLPLASGLKHSLGLLKDQVRGAKR